MGLTRDVSKLAPEFQVKVKALLERLDNEGFRYVIIETLRDKKVQEAYYAQGRQHLAVVNYLRKEAGLWPISAEENERCITWTHKSKHLLGLAIDIAPAKEDGNPHWAAHDRQWRKLAETAKELGLESGYYWPEKDCAHIQASK